MKNWSVPFLIVATMIVVISLLSAFLKEPTEAAISPTTIDDLSVQSAIPHTSDGQLGLLVSPKRQGQFTSAGSTNQFQFVVENTSNSLSDTIEIDVNSEWSIDFYHADGQTPLNDSNGDSRLDVPNIPPGDSVTVTAVVTTPVSATRGDFNRVTISLTSTIDPSQQGVVILQLAVPSPFSHAFRNDALKHITLFIAEPESHWSQDLTSMNGTGAEVAIAETVAGYVYVWSYQRLEGNFYVTDLELALIDKNGNPYSGLVKVTDHSSSDMAIHDVNPVVAIDSGGNIGISWHRQVFDASGNVNENIFLAILDSEGQVVMPEKNLTNNAAWGTRGDVGLPAYDSPRIAGITDGGFFTAWENDKAEDVGNIQDIYYSILDESGTTVVAPTNLTNDAPDDNGNVAPAVAGLSTGRTLISWIVRRSGNDDLFIVVIDNEGAIVSGPEDISEDDSVTDWWNFDATELSNGSILLAWQAWGCIEGEYTGRTRFAVLSSNYRRIGRATCLGPDGIAVGGDKAVSLSADNTDHGIVTWTDHDAANRRSLYYSLIDKRGNIVTEPMAFYTNQTTGSLISLNYEGYASTSRNYVDGLAQFSAPHFYVSSGEEAKITIQYGNVGTINTGEVILTTTLNEQLTYISDTAPRKPTIEGNVITWLLPEIDPATGLEFDILSSVPPTATAGTVYPVTVSIGLDTIESTINNNTDNADVILRQSMYLPLLSK